MMNLEPILDFYRRPAQMTAAGGHAAALDGLSGEVPALAEVVQGLLLHEHMAAPAYGVQLSAARREESHLRSTERMLDRLLDHKVELLPWDDWGGMVGPDEPLSDEQLAWFDELAALTRAPDAPFDELRARYEGDERLRVPVTVFNALRSCQETI